MTGVADRDCVNTGVVNVSSQVDVQEVDVNEMTGRDTDVDLTGVTGLVSQGVVGRCDVPRG